MIKCIRDLTNLNRAMNLKVVAVSMTTASDQAQLSNLSGSDSQTSLTR